MTDLTPEQRITLSTIDAAGNIAEAAQAIAHALTEAASVLRQITSPYGFEPCHGDCGWPPEEDLVDDEAPDEPAEDQPQNTAERFRAFVAKQNAAKPELSAERHLDIERSDAGFTSGSIWVGGLGEYEGHGVYWAESDRGITHDQLMDACEGLSDDERREAHRRAANLATVRFRSPTVRDLLTALGVVRRRRDSQSDDTPNLINVNGFCSVCMAELTSSAFDVSAVPPSGARVALHERRIWQEVEPERSVVDVVEALEATPTPRDIVDIEPDRLQELGQGGGGGANYGGGKNATWTRSDGSLGVTTNVIDGRPHPTLEECGGDLMEWANAPGAGWRSCWERPPELGFPPYAGVAHHPLDPDRGTRIPRESRKCIEVDADAASFLTKATSPNLNWDTSGSFPVAELHDGIPISSDGEREGGEYRGAVQQMADEIADKYGESLKALADGAEPGCTHAPVHTESTGWTIGWQDSFGRECPEGPHAAPFAKPVPPQEAQDAPNAAPLPQPADASEAGCAASSAAPGGNPADWRWVNPHETELAGDAHEWDALTKHLEDPRPSPVGPCQTNTTAPTLRGPLFPPPVGWVKGDAGRFPAVDISGPIKD